MTDAELVHTMSIETNDLEELQDSGEGWDQQYRQLFPGAYKGVLDMRIIGSRQIFREVYGLKTLYEGTAPAGGFGYALPLDQSGNANWVGETVTNDAVVLQAPGQEANLVSGDRWDALVFGVPEEEVRTIYSALSNNGGLDGNFHEQFSPQECCSLVLFRLPACIRWPRCRCGQAYS